MQLAAALNHCHNSLKLIHRDVKPANIFLTDNGDVKLGDFNHVRVFGEALVQAGRYSNLHGARS